MDAPQIALMKTYGQIVSRHKSHTTTQASENWEIASSNMKICIKDILKMKEKTKGERKEKKRKRKEKEKKRKEEVENEERRLQVSSKMSNNKNRNESFILHPCFPEVPSRVELLYTVLQTVT